MPLAAILHTGCMSDSEGWIEEYRREVRDQHAAESMERQQRLKREQERTEYADRVRIYKERIVSEYRSVLAERIMQTYRLLIAAGSPGTEEIQPRKGLKPAKRGWRFTVGALLTDGTSPKYLGVKGKYRMRSVEEVAADALETKYRVAAGSTEEKSHVHDRLSWEELEIREWAEKVIDTWSRHLADLLERTHARRDA